MPRYIISQTVAIITMLVGWSTMLGGSALTFMLFDKAQLIATMPAKMALTLGAIPDLMFILPAVLVFVFGLIVVAIGHTLHVSVDNAKYPNSEVPLPGNRENYGF